MAKTATKTTKKPKVGSGRKGKKAKKGATARGTATARGSKKRVPGGTKTMTT